MRSRSFSASSPLTVVSVGGSVSGGSVVPGVVVVLSDGSVSSPLPVVPAVSVICGAGRFMKEISYAPACQSMTAEIIAAKTSSAVALTEAFFRNFIWFILCRAFPPVDRIYLWYFPLFAMESARYICSSSITRMS